jgi:cytidine deaminase
MSVSESLRADLAEAARAASARAYCPYSHFRVGAAVLAEGGRIFSGCNVENASYGLTICAERNAVFQAVAQLEGCLVIRAVVIYTPTPEPTAPCGACRQVINEFGPDAEIRSICDGPRDLRLRLSELLPAAFGPGNLASDDPGE